jgi:hypothetical protein
MNRRAFLCGSVAMLAAPPTVLTGLMFFNERRRFVDLVAKNRLPAVQQRVI